LKLKGLKHGFPILDCRPPRSLDAIETAIGASPILRISSGNVRFVISSGTATASA